MSGMQHIGVSDTNVNPSVAGALGGANATGSSMGNFGSGLAAAGSLYSISQGVRSGTPTGYAGAAVGGASLANSAGAFGQHANSAGQLVNGNVNVGAGLGIAGGGLGIYNGVKQGGVAGYGNATAGALNVAAGAAALSGSSALAGTLSSSAGAIAAPIALYSEIKNWQSGATGADALGGAATGAAIGTAIMPGIGTAIGAIGGAIAGAASSAFGNGRVDPENANFEGYTQAYNKAPVNQQAALAKSVQNPYQVLAGYFDLRSNQLKGDNPMYQSYGRAGEQKFTNDLVSQIQLGKSHGVSDPTAMYSQVVMPWINSMGNWNDSNKNAMSALLQNMTGQIMSGTYKNNFKAIGGQQVFT